MDKRHVEYNFRLDVRKSGNQASIRVRKGERRARQIVATLTNGSTPIDYEYLDSAVFRAEKADGTQIMDECQLIGSTIIYNMSEQLTTVDGTADCEFMVYGVDGTILYSPKFSVYVEDELYNVTRIASTDEYKALINALAIVRYLESNEEDRVEAEIMREDNEAVREANEAQRIENEAQRETNEAEREAKLSKISVDTKTLPAAQLAYGKISMDAINGIRLLLGLPKGPKGDPGTGWKLKGTVATAEELDAVQNPERGDAYGVGAAAPYDVYIYNGPIVGWKNYGPIQGAYGEQGEPGAYYLPSVSPEGVISWENSGGFTNPEPINIKGPQGIQGKQGDKGDAFKYSDFTSDQLEGLKGPKGDPGADAQLPDWVGPKKPVYAATEISEKNNTNVQNAIDTAASDRQSLRTGKADRVRFYTCTLLASNWTPEEGFQVQRVAVDGLKRENEKYEFEPVHTSTDVADEKNRLKAWGKVSFIKVLTDGIASFFCTGEAPKINLKLRVSADN